MSKTVIGRNLPLYKGNYDKSKTYDIYDVVLNNGSSYVSKKKNNVGNSLTNTEFWQLLAKNGEFTEEDKETFKQAVVEESKTTINEHTETKKTELDNYTTNLKTSLKNELDTYEEGKEEELNTHKTTLETEMTNTKDNLVEEIETAQNGFDENATLKKIEFNNNATEQTNTFNSNAETKTADFNANASTKQTEYDDNATSKLEEYNNNSTTKLAEFNENAESYEKRIAELETERDEIAQQMPWNTTYISESIHIEDSAKYSRNKLNVFGNLKQETRSGRNFFNVEDSSFSWNTLTVAIVNNILKVKIGDGIGGIVFGTQGKYTEYNFDTSKKYFFSLFRKKGDLEFLESTNNKWLRFYIYIKYEDDSISNTFVEITNKMTQKSKEIIFTEGKKPVSYAIGRYSPNNTLKNNQTAEYYIQLEEDTATEFEEYGAMPSIEYPSMPVVATGVQTIKKIKKNCYDISKFNTDTNMKNFSGHWIYLKPNTAYTISTNMVSNANEGNGLQPMLGNPTIDNAYIVTTTDITATSLTSSSGVGILTHKTRTVVTGETGAIFIGNRNAVTSLKNMVVQGGYIQIEEGDIATPYEPYTEEVFELDLGTTELCKITDTNGNVVAQDKFVFKDGKWQINKIYGKRIFNENSKWGIEGTNNFFVNEIIEDSKAVTHNELISNIFPKNYTVNERMLISNNKKFNMITHKIEHTVEAIKEYCKTTNIVLYYPTLEPTYEDCTVEQSEVLDKLYKLQLEKGINNIFVESENGVTTELQLEYMQDLQSKLNQLESMIISNAGEEVTQ